MTHYLTPAKIGLLALLELYAEEVLPTESSLPILTFITSHLMDADVSQTSSPSTRFSKAERTVSLVISIRDFEALLSPYPVLHGMPGRRLWDSFLRRLWHINSLNALHEFFARLPLLLAKSKDELRQLPEEERAAAEAEVKFSKTSRFGLFVRNCLSEFECVKFHQVTELWRSFVRYRQETAPYLRKRSSSFERLSFDNVLLTGEQEEEWGTGGVGALAGVVYGDMLTGHAPNALPVSTDDIEKLLEFQIEKMQKYNTRVPAEIRHQFNDLLNDSLRIPSVSHYVSFLEAWRAGDYPNAIDNLHRYFDYTLQDRDRLFYQYALMNLAVVQAEFGCYKEAVEAMLETVSSARENRDMTCLNFALNWLFHFGRSHPQFLKQIESSSTLGSEKETLAFLRVKAKESNMWTLWAAVFLTEATMGLSHGESVASAWESMVRGSQVIVERNMRNMFAPQMLLSIALWDRLGLGSLAATSCYVFLGAHAVNSLFDDELKTTCRLALSLANKGKYGAALAVLDSLDENSLRVCRSSQYFLKYRAAIKLRRDLSMGELDGAEEFLDQLLQSKTDDMEPDIAFNLETMHVDLLIRRGDLPRAFDLVEDHLSRLKDENEDIALNVRLLLLKALLYDKAGRPQRGFTTTVRASSLALRARLLPLLWESIGLLSNILVSLSEFEAASQLLEAIIPRALECEIASLSGHLYSSLADAYMGMAGKAAKGSRARREYVAAVVGALDKAFEWFSNVEDRARMGECLGKKAVVMKVMGESEAAGQAVGRYAALVRGDGVKG